MKIEMISENQIRCTLTKDDLAARQIRLSELAYGSDKAKDLFSEMMQMASEQYGFDAENTPLMVEAIPLNPECLVVVITKTEDAEELDTRFSQFGPSIEEDGENFSENDDFEDDIMDLFHRLQSSDLSDSFQELSGNSSPKKLKTKPGQTRIRQGEKPSTFRIYGFRSLHEIIALAGSAKDYTGKSLLYRDDNNQYLLLLYPDNSHPEAFSSLCSRIAEYGVLLDFGSAGPEFLAEHKTLVISGDHALLRLSEI